MIIATMVARITAWMVWTLLAVCTVAWGLKLFVRPEPVPAHARMVTMEQTLKGDPLRLFASVSSAASSPAASASAGGSATVGRFRLVGMAAAPSSPTSDRQGVALLSIDGKPARAFEVGDWVDGDWVLQSVSARQVRLGPVGQAAVTVLDLPALPPPATGILSASAQRAADWLKVPSPAQAPTAVPAAVNAVPGGGASPPPPAAANTPAPLGRPIAAAANVR
jgi:general secretion pathway protein C